MEVAHVLDGHGRLDDLGLELGLAVCELEAVADAVEAARAELSVRGERVPCVCMVCMRSWPSTTATKRHH